MFYVWQGAKYVFALIANKKMAKLLKINLKLFSKFFASRTVRRVLK